MKYISIKEAVKQFGVSRSTIFKLFNEGALTKYQLPHVKRRTFINLEEFEKLFTAEYKGFCGCIRNPSAPMVKIELSDLVDMDGNVVDASNRDDFWAEVCKQFKLK